MNILDRYHAMDYGPAPEARNEADAWLAARDFGKALFIGGDWKAASGDKTFETSEPSSGKLLAKVSDASAADIDGKGYFFAFLHGWPIGGEWTGRKTGE